MWLVSRTISIRSCRVHRWLEFTRCINRSFSSALFETIHKPVLLQEAMEYLSPKPGNTYCDLTFGDGGYTRALLDSCDCKVVAVDQDPAAYEKALQLAQHDEYRGRLFPLLGRFGEINRLVKQGLQWDRPCFDGLVMDIGVSSAQLETASRGFSYQLEGPLDMRMFSRGKQSSEKKFDEEERLLHKSVSAYEVVNYYNQNHLADIIYKYGGDRLSRKIASAIVSARHKRPIETTTELAAIVNKACPQPRWQRGDDDMVRNSAARTFQAIRIHVNDELGELESALRSSEYLLRAKGRLVVVTFHSLEDRIVKTFLNHCAGRRNVQDSRKFASAKEAYRQAMRGKIELQAPIKEWGDASFTLCTKRVVKASQEERAENMRSRSAKLRAAERTEAPPLAPFGPL